MIVFLVIQGSQKVGIKKIFINFVISFWNGDEKKEYLKEYKKAILYKFYLTYITREYFTKEDENF